MSEPPDRVQERDVLIMALATQRIAGARAELEAATLSLKALQADAAVRYGLQPGDQTSPQPPYLITRAPRPALAAVNNEPQPTKAARR